MNRVSTVSSQLIGVKVYYSQQLSNKTAPTISSKVGSRNIISTKSYAPLSEVVQRAQQQPNSLSSDEWQQLDNAIGTRAVQGLLAGRPESWKPEFKSISEQLNSSSKPENHAAQAKKTELKMFGSQGPEAKQGEGKTAIALNNTNTKCVQRTRDKIPDNFKVGSELSKWIEYYNNYIGAPENDYGKQIFLLGKISTEIANREKNITRPIRRRTQSQRGEETSKIKTTLDQLKNEISQKDKVARKEAKDKAEAEHKEDIKILVEIVEQGSKSKDIRLKNSCEWIKTGRAKLYALTPTGDSYARTKEKKKDPDQYEAFFPDMQMFPDEDIYNTNPPALYVEDDLSNNLNVCFDKRTNLGLQAGKNIEIVNPRKSDSAKIHEILRHEMQHLVDEKFLDYFPLLEPLVKDTKNMLGKAKLKKEIKDITALASYISEYQAYYYQGSYHYDAGKKKGEERESYNQYDDNKKEKMRYEGIDTDFEFTDRQYYISKRIYSAYPDVKTALKDNPVLANGRKFREVVQDYHLLKTDSINKFNSIRVDDFYEALNRIGKKNKDGTILEPETNEKEQKVKYLIGKIDKLKEYEALDILSKGLMWEKIHDHLGGEALEKVIEKLRSAGISLRL